MDNPFFIIRYTWFYSVVFPQTFDTSDRGDDTIRNIVGRSECNLQNMVSLFVSYQNLQHGYHPRLY